MNTYKLASSTWDDAELKAIQSVIDKDMYTMSDYVFEFESKFAEYTGSRYCVMVNSGSSANLLAIASLFYTKNPRLNRGDEVIVPAVSWSTTYYPLYQYGLKLKFVDVDLGTLNYDLKALEEAVSKSTKMILAVNLLGNPNDFQKIQEIIGNRDIMLFEDNCESMGARFQGKQAGTFGIMGSFSTFFSHHMSTMEGGLIVTDDKELYHILLSIRSHGWTRHLPEDNLVAKKSPDWFTESFRFVLPGYNLRPLEMSGAIGIEQLKKLPAFIDQRRKNAAHFVEKFKGHPDFLIQLEIEQSSWFGFSLIIKPDSPRKRSEVIKELDSNGIESRPIVTGDFTKNEVLRYFDYEVHGALPNAKYLDKNGFFVGNHQIPLFKEIDHLYEVLRG
ncbi:DegT/DnrJ/EryC1/StrS family aminotransferase [Muriicola marianensis]|uniref:CDP-4-keto-6-deoxy-D-glucose-3-dehydrase n=1 Tax=Muriicola marianensis TaxID=1324801 RepID=A0ABQ1QWG1_9FLAO|nr:DegT/DnrJ/EryC1/StrS family aminotransferase [Muriicola marianensis]GGD49846.1 CDP-4-keto-6-deoxy-D-glucose-3-dehydrase [Muriicola marianensis]